MKEKKIVLSTLIISLFPTGKSLEIFTKGINNNRLIS